MLLAKLQGSQDCLPVAPDLKWPGDKLLSSLWELLLTEELYEMSKVFSTSTEKWIHPIGVWHVIRNVSVSKYINSIP